MNAEALIQRPHQKMVETINRWSLKQALSSKDWPFWRRNDQNPSSDDWRVWLVMAGRGYGKTRMGAEWVRCCAMTSPGARIALVGATISEARSVMMEGESGLLALCRDDKVNWEPSLRKLSWPNGSVATLYSAAEPESLRGPQHDFAWADEIAKWPHGIATWDNMMFGLRLGDHPRVMATTTPRPVPLVRRLVSEAGVERTNGSTKHNAMNLPREFIDGVNALYAGTRLGRQELDGELIEDIAGALWTRDLLEERRVIAAPELKRVVIGVDPPVSAHGDTTSAIDEFKAFDTETFAEILALETLFPLELRLHHKEAYESGEISDYQLALRYRIPEEFARLAMYPSYYAKIIELRDGTLVI